MSLGRRFTLRYNMGFGVTKIDRYFGQIDKFITLRLWGKCESRAVFSMFKIFGDSWIEFFSGIRFVTSLCTVSIWNYFKISNIKREINKSVKEKSTRAQLTEVGKVFNFAVRYTQNAEAWVEQVVPEWLLFLILSGIIYFLS